MPSQSVYADSEASLDSDDAFDLNDATQNFAQLQADLAEAKEALKDVKMKRAKDRKDLLEEKQQRRNLEAEVRALKSNTQRAGERRSCRC